MNQSFYQKESFLERWLVKCCENELKCLPVECDLLLELPLGEELREWLLCLLFESLFWLLLCERFGDDGNSSLDTELVGENSLFFLLGVNWALESEWFWYDCELDGDMFELDRFEFWSWRLYLESLSSRWLLLDSSRVNVFDEGGLELLPFSFTVEPWF